MLWRSAGHDSNRRTGGQAVIVEAKNFHPMRGHVEDGTEIIFPDRMSIWIRPVTRGWILADSEGKTIFGPFDSAQDLTAQIVWLEQGVATLPDRSNRVAADESGGAR